MRRIEEARTRRVAQGLASQESQTIEPSVTPEVAQAPAQQFNINQAATRTAELPFGQELQVGAETGASEQRARPEFGSFFGSGVLENVASSALPALENAQKFFETVGGAATLGASAAIPGVDIFGIEKKFIENYNERGRPFNPAGILQNTAETFRETKMPSTRLDIVPGQGINLPGDSYLNEIDVGVKGAIELLPDAALAILTGGSSLAGTGIRGAAKAAGTTAARTVGLDILASGAKQAGRAVTGAQNIRAVAAPVRKNITNITFGRGVARVDRMGIEEVKNGINRLPASMQGAMSGVMSAISPVALLDHSNKLARFAYGRLNSMSLIPGAVETNMAILANKMGGVGNLPIVTGERIGLDIGRQMQRSPVGRLVGRFRDAVKGANPEVPVFQVDEKGLIVGSGLKELDGKAWVDIAQSFFEGDFNHIRQSVLKGSKNYIPLDITGKVIRTADDPKEFSHFAIKVKGGGFETNQGTKVASFFRHYLETVEDMSRHYELAAGKAIVKTSKMRFQDGFYAPQVPNGGNLFDETRPFASAQPKLPGDKPRPLKERSLFGDTLQEAIDSGDYILAGPMESLQTLMNSLYSGAIDQGFAKSMKRLAKEKGSGVINFATRHNRAKATALSIKKGKNVHPETLARMKEDGFGVVAEQLRKIKAAEDPAEKKVLTDALDGLFDRNVRELQGQYYQIPSPSGRIPPAFAGLMFENKTVAKRVADASEISPANEKGVISFFAKSGDLLRVAKTGFDFGFHMIHGLPALGLAFGRFAAGHPVESARLYKAWGKSVKQTFDAFVRPKVLVETLMREAPLVQEAVEHGLQISRAAQDTFLAIQNNTILAGVPKYGKNLDELVTELARSFERAFVGPGDLLRIEGYKALRTTAAQSENGLEELAGFLNKMTGALSSSSFGVARSQQQVERAFLFFSPRYTRAAMGLLSDFYRGGLRGELARQSIVGMLWMGTATYIAFAEAFGQDPELDPSSSKFMTLEVGDDRVGVGGFWTQFARVTSRLASTAWDEDSREAFGGEDFARTNQLIKWVRSRSAPSAGVAWDVVVGEDFMGREISGPKDWAQHAGRQTLPIWVEAGLIEDPYRTGFLGVASEIGGARVRPLSAGERRRDLREALSEAAYGIEWNDLNTLQRKRIESGEAPNVAADEVDLLDELSSLVRDQRAEIGEEDDVAVEKWYVRRDKIEEEWIQNVGTGLDHLSSGAIDLEKFRTMYLSNANGIRRAKMTELNDIEGDFAPAVQYFQDTAEKFGEDHPEDVAYSEYIDQIIATDAFDKPEGFDFRARNDAVLAFRQRWGDDVYAYVQEVFSTGRDIPPLVEEFWKGRAKFEYYWSGVEEATLQSMPRAGEVRNEYQQWLESTDLEKKQLEAGSRLLKRFLSRMSDVKVELRKKDSLLDAWLYRWGYTSTLLSSGNDVAPDGISNPNEFWRQSQPFPFEVFGIGTGVQLGQDVGNLQPSV